MLARKALSHDFSHDFVAPDLSKLWPHLGGSEDTDSVAMQQDVSNAPLQVLVSILGFILSTGEAKYVDTFESSLALHWQAKNGLAFTWTLMPIFHTVWKVCFQVFTEGCGFWVTTSVDECSCCCADKMGE